MFWLVLKGLKALFSFLTIVPVGMESIEAVSKYFFLCPLVGLVLGLVAGAVGFASSFFLPELISGLHFHALCGQKKTRLAMLS